MSVFPGSVTAISIPADRSQPITVESIWRDYELYFGGCYAVSFLCHPRAFLTYTEIADPDRDPLNERATLVLCCCSARRIGRANIFGDALIVGYVNGTGSDTDAPELLIDALTGAKPVTLEQRETETGPWRRRESLYESWEEACIAAVGIAHTWQHVVAVRLVVVDPQAR
jgi:hypothetical protein